MVAGFQEQVPQESKAEAHGTFMVLPQKLYSMTDCYIGCHALLVETITKVCPGSRGGIKMPPSHSVGRRINVVL